MHVSILERRMRARGTLEWAAVDGVGVAKGRSVNGCPKRSRRTIVAEWQWWSSRDFGQCLWEHGNFDGTMYGDSRMVVFRGFKWYSDLLKTTRRRKRTVKDKAKDLPKNTSGSRKRK
jgi:hypothetical protein